MTDEAAMLLRVSLFGFVTGIVYWFLSYEWLGTIALLLLGAGPGFAGLILVQERRRQGGPAESRADTLRRFAGIPSGDPPGPADKRDEDLGVLPLPTIWPFAASLGVAILLTGLIYGLWLIVLGAGVAAYGTWGWLAAINRENRYGRIQAEHNPAPPAEPAHNPEPPAEPPERSDPAED
jgi:Cytochrome c oxidase subunit IV